MIKIFIKIKYKNERASFNRLSKKNERQLNPTLGEDDEEVLPHADRAASGNAEAISG